MRVDVVINAVALGVTSLEVILIAYSLLATYSANRSY